jgi:RNA polymerase sigma-70 factor (ECF subfamily)
MASSNGNGQPDLTSYYSGIREYLRRFANNGVTAEDLAQSTFVRAYSGLENGSVPMDIAAWLRAIALNVGYDQIKKDRRYRGVALDHALESVLYDESVREPVESILDEEARRRLRSAIDTLSHKEQILLRAYYAPDRHLFSPAIQFGMPASRAKVYAYRIRKKLKRALEGP